MGHQILLPNRTYYLLILVPLAIAFSGCLLPGPGTSITFAGDIHQTETGIIMEGHITDTTASEKTFDNTTIYFYDSNKTLIKSVSIGDLHVRRDVNITVHGSPKYIIIYSPDFWSSHRVQVEYIERNSEGQYMEWSVANPNELPVRPESPHSNSLLNYA